MWKVSSVRDIKFNGKFRLTPILMIMLPLKMGICVKRCHFKESDIHWSQIVFWCLVEAFITILIVGKAYKNTFMRTWVKIRMPRIVIMNKCHSHNLFLSERRPWVRIIWAWALFRTTVENPYIATFSSSLRVGRATSNKYLIWLSRLQTSNQTPNRFPLSLLSSSCDEGRAVARRWGLGARFQHD